MKKRKYFKFLLTTYFGLVFSLLFLLSVFYNNYVYAQTAVIDSTVDINICGDNVTEKPAEECDNTDLDDKTCQSYGYDFGSISCNSDCTINTSNCELDESKNESEDSVSSSSSDESSSDSATSSETSSTLIVNSEQDNLIQTVQNTINNLVPTVVTQMDTNGDGKLEVTELRDVITAWVNSLRENDLSGCDLNDDKQCTIEDVSIVLYYFE